MSTTITIFPEEPHAELIEDGGPPLAVIELSPYPSRAALVLRTYAEADELIRAAEEARRLLATLPEGGQS